MVMVVSSGLGEALDDEEGAVEAVLQLDCLQKGWDACFVHPSSSNMWLRIPAG